MEFNEQELVMMQKQIYDMANTEPWVKYGDDGKRSIDINALADAYIAKTSYFRTSDYLPGWYWEGRHWVRYTTKETRDASIRADLSAMLGKNYKPVIVKQTLETVLDLSFDDSKQGVFEKNVSWVSFKNTAINVETLERKPNQKNLYLIGGFDYDLPASDETTDVTAPLMCQMLTDLFGDAGAKFFLEFTGYMFKRQYAPFQHAVIVQGKAGTGKSVLFNLVTKMLGKQNVSSVSLHDLSDDRFAAVGVVDKYANIRSDISSDFIKDASIIKNLVGDDSMTVQAKGQQPFAYSNYAKMLFSANEVPTIAPDAGIQRRIIILPVVGIVHADVNGSDKFDYAPYDAERGEFVLLAIEAFSKAVEHGKWTTSQLISDATSDWNNAGDDIKMWATEHLKQDEFARPKARDVYDYFHTDLEHDGLKIFPTARTFYQRMSSLGYEFRKAKPVVVTDQDNTVTNRLIGYEYHS